MERIPARSKSWILHSKRCYFDTSPCKIKLYSSITQFIFFSIKGKINLFFLYEQLYSESLLVDLPTPVFSMLFNVICLSCTAIAFAFVGLHNLTTKEFGFGEERPKIPCRQRLEDLRFRVMATQHPLIERISRKQPQQQREHANLCFFLLYII